MTFQAAALAVYAAADITGLAGGSIQLLDGTTVLATVAFNSGTAGTSSGAVFTGAGFPKTVTASAAGTITSARFRTSAAADYKTGITVGIAGSGAQVIVDNGLGTLAIASGQAVRIEASPTLTHTAA